MRTRASLERLVMNVALDGVLAAAAVPTARWITEPSAPAFQPSWPMPAVALAVLLAGLPFGLSRQYWRFAGMGDLIRVAGAAILGTLLFLAGLKFVVGQDVSAADGVALVLTLIAFLALPRIVYREYAGRRAGGRPTGDGGPDGRSVLLVGSAEDADLFLRAVGSRADPAYHVVGVVGTGARQTGRRIDGRPILGTLREIGAVLDQLRADGRLPDTIVVASPDIDGPQLGRLLDEADRHGLPVRRAPRPTALDPPTRRAAEPLAGPELKPVVIEDLLNRAQVPLDREGMARLIQGSRVLVTGAGGTIGSELARQIAALGPERLVLLDNGEYALWQIDLELAETHSGIRRRAVIADIRDEARIRAIMDEVRPELVFHAAALKHVPIVEDNPLEGLLTNAAGTRHVADAARAAGARAMVLISTDKAVNPTSVMGASKRLAEMYCQALDIAARTGGSGMRCVTVRFGNVLGSTGSVVPLFRRQLERGGPLTVTHPDMQRYFMTVREAVGLVLQASVLGVAGAALPSGDQGGIFVLDMGAPVKIVDLARRMIRLAGLRPDEDVEIRFTGLRPGEKLYEELFHGKEPPVPTGYAGLLMARPRTADPAIVGRAIDEVAAAARAGQGRLALTLLGRMVPEFDHQKDGAAGVSRSG